MQIIANNQSDNRIIGVLPEVDSSKQNPNTDPDCLDLIAVSRPVRFLGWRSLQLGGQDA